VRGERLLASRGRVAAHVACRARRAFQRAQGHLGPQFGAADPDIDGGGEAPGLQHTRGLGDGEAEALLDSVKSARRRSGCDPLVQSCARDLRPGPYARDFADRAGVILLAEDGGPRPPWWQAVRNAARAQRCAIAPHAALAQLRAVAAD